MKTAISSPDAANLPVDQYMTAVGQAARVAATVMAAASTAAKNNALLALARQIRQHAGELKARNESDVIAAQQ
ncbi:MAG TPA: gamma-glutamyl-phosphate reductase, partial [Aquabacterium sp.]|nr:gamma-glutamyl-phosphate reductase [Aquabacterium sp.]